MTFRETFYNVKRLMESRLHDFGLESADADTMGWTTMLSIEQNTNLTINVPLNLIYDDNFNISGVLETSTFSRLANKTIKLKVGNTVVDTTTTNNYGEYSFTQTPVSMGNHTFQAIFEGTNIHGSSTSPTVTRDILRETTVLNASANLNVISGTLISDDFEQTNEVLPNATIKIYENNNLIDSTTTDNLGRFSYTYNGTSIDTTLTLEYEQTENYTGSIKDVHVVLYDSISLSTDKSILSYSDGESATLSAQLLGNGSNANVSGVSIDFLIYDEDNTLLDTLTASTDSNGVATVSYYSEGTGNINITATTTNISSNNIRIEDLLFYPKLDGTDDIIQIAGTTTFNNGIMSGGSAIFANGWDNTRDWEMTLETMHSSRDGEATFLLKSPNYPIRDAHQLIFHSPAFSQIYWTKTNGDGKYYISNWGSNKWVQLTIKKIGTTVTITYNNTDYTITDFEDINEHVISCGVDTWGTICSIKNIKVKSL